MMCKPIEMLAEWYIYGVLNEKYLQHSPTVIKSWIRLTSSLGDEIINPLTGIYIPTTRIPDNCGMDYHILAMAHIEITQRNIFLPMKRHQTVILNSRKRWMN